MSLFTDDMIISVGNLMESTKLLLELINEFSKVSGYKINIIKNYILYTSSEQSQVEIQTTIYNTIKNLEYLVTNLNKRCEKHV